MKQLVKHIIFTSALITILVPAGSVSAQSCLAQALFLPGKQTVYAGGAEKTYRICMLHSTALGGEVKIIADSIVQAVWPKGASERCIDVSGKRIELEMERGGTLEYGAI